MCVAILYFVPRASKSRRSREIDPQRPAVAAAGDLDLAIRVARMAHRGQMLAPVLERADRAATVARGSLTRNRAIVGVKTANAGLPQHDRASVGRYAQALTGLSAAACGSAGAPSILTCSTPTASLTCAISRDCTFG